MSRYISLSQVAANAAIALGLEQMEYSGIFYEWAYQATRSIGITEANLLTSTITITDGMADAPSGMVKPNNIAIKKNASGEIAYPFFDSNYWTDVPQVDQVKNNQYIVNFQQDKFVFSSSVTEDGFDRLVLQYWSVPVDDDGSPLIPEYYDRAVVAYIEYMYVKRLRNRNRSEVPMSEIQILDAKWKELKLDAVVQRNTPSKPEIEGAIAEWLTMLPNFSRLKRRNNVDGR